MDKEVLVEFTKGMAIGSLRMMAYAAVVVAVIFGFNYVGFPPDEAILIGTISVVAVMFIYFSFDMAWHRAKSKVDYRRKWGKEL
jgi:hypothetical protein